MTNPLSYTGTALNAIRLDIVDRLTLYGRHNSSGQSTFSIKDFGATGDGVTDDTASLRAALNSIRTNGGGVLYIPSGTFIISEEIIIDRETYGNVSIRGEGQNASILSRPFDADEEQSLMTLTDMVGVTISALKFEGNVEFDSTKEESGYNNLTLDNCSRSVLIDIDSRNVNVGSCIHLSNGSGNSIFSCSTENSPIGINLSSEYGASVSHCYVKHHRGLPGIGIFLAGECNRCSIFMSHSQICNTAISIGQDGDAGIGNNVVDCFALDTNRSAFIVSGFAQLIYGCTVMSSTQSAGYPIRMDDISQCDIDVTVENSGVIPTAALLRNSNGSNVIRIRKMDPELYGIELDGEGINDRCIVYNVGGQSLTGATAFAESNNPTPTQSILQSYNHPSNGSTTLGTSDTTATVVHGFGTTPLIEHIMLTHTSSTTIHPFITNITSTTFDITRDIGDIGSPLTVHWRIM